MAKPGPSSRLSFTVRMKAREASRLNSSGRNSSSGGGPNRPSTYCAVIVKTVDERTRSKTSINELLRD